MTMLSSIVREGLISLQTIQLHGHQTLSSFQCVPENHIFVDNVMGMCVIMIWRTQEFCSGGAQQIQLRTEDRENGDLGAVAPWR